MDTVLDYRPDVTIRVEGLDKLNEHLERMPYSFSLGTLFGFGLAVLIAFLVVLMFKSRTKL